MKLSFYTLTRAWIGAIALTLAACSSAPPAPNWQVDAKGAMDRAVAAYLEGNTRVEQAERTQARQQIARTGRADLIAQAELLHCAARVASLVWEPCTGFETLRPDATPSQRAYADYLRGQVAASDIPLLPELQLKIAALRAPNDGSALPSAAEPLSILVASGVLLQTGKASPAVIEQAVNVASSQGWRRPLLAWLGVQVQRAKQAGQTTEAERLLRRVDLVQGTASR